MQVDQHAYWDQVAPQKTFSHPLDPDWIDTYFQHDMAIVDIGCGYGRTLGDLQQMGFQQLTGVDYSLEMLKRAQELLPGMTLLHNEAPNSLWQIKARKALFLRLYSPVFLQIRISSNW